MYQRRLSEKAMFEQAFERQPRAERVASESNGIYEKV